MAGHSYFKVRKDGDHYLIQQATPHGYQTVGTSDSRTKANQSAGIRDSKRIEKQRGG